MLCLTVSREDLKRISNGKKGTVSETHITDEAKEDTLGFLRVLHGLIPQN